ncbi:hypothetical protein LSM04_006493 [Trypanosoma melophagium]|uniref:uncharacterized protein n=1 Tax=Trypanosoma melophagium TaxID=715481 RepID=UPI00351A1140|nr:hypothetical protein LSM04_006493 [Trypanosoma melophagium]
MDSGSGSDSVSAGVDVHGKENRLLKESDDSSSSTNNNNNNSNRVKVGKDDEDLHSPEAHYLKDVEMCFHVSSEKTQKPISYTLEENLKEDGKEELKLSSASLRTGQESGLESEGSTLHYREALFRRAEQLLQAGTHFDRHVEEAEKQLGQLKRKLEPHVVNYSTEQDALLGLSQPSLIVIRDRDSFCEEEVEPVPQPPDVIPAQTELSSPTSITNLSSALFAAAADNAPGRGSSDVYKRMLLSRDEELQKANKEFERYTTEIAKHFKKSPVVLPDHLQNCFTGENVIVARDHKGRMDVPGHSLNESKVPSCHGEEVRGSLVVSLQRQLNNSGVGKTSWQIQCEQQKQLMSDSSELEPPPRFTIVSLPNGDLRERDACAGMAYWDAAEPVDVPRVVPSQLLDERIEEAYHNYRYYSRRWRALLVDLANTLGGEDGAELLRRYEQREESLPLSPRCQRAFYESVVDYDELLQQQESIMEAVERDLEEYQALMLDGPVASL